MRLRFERYLSHYQPDEERNIPQNQASLNIHIHDVINFNVLHMSVREQKYCTVTALSVCANFWQPFSPALRKCALSLYCMDSSPLVEPVDKQQGQQTVRLYSK